MSHGEGWQFIQLGRFVERIDILTGLLAHIFPAWHNRRTRPLREQNIWSGSDC